LFINKFNKLKVLLRNFLEGKKVETNLKTVETYLFGGLNNFLASFKFQCMRSLSALIDPQDERCLLLETDSCLIENDLQPPPFPGKQIKIKQKFET
jgi:hypothetical protein